jgi:hypothetical protein
MVRAYAKTLHMPNKYKILNECISHDAIKNREDGCKICNGGFHDGDCLFYLASFAVFHLANMNLKSGMEYSDGSSDIG